MMCSPINQDTGRVMSETVSTQRDSRIEAGDLAHIAVFAALIAALSLAPPIPVGGIGVPITLQTLGVALTGLCLGPARGFAAVALYLAVGAAGLPVFAQGRAGLGIFATPTGGYLISFLFAVLLTGFLARVIVRRGLSRATPFLFLGALLLSRLVIIAPFGIAGMMRAGDLGLGEAFAIDVVFWPGDLLKSLVACFLAFTVHKAFPRLLRR